MWEPGKPSQSENEYFARRDAEWLKEQRAALDRERRGRLRARRDTGGSSALAVTASWPCETWST